jgi:uncharacterized phage-associated protein
MPISALSAARAICERKDWRVSNLELQKILYIAQMIHLGLYKRPLINERFEAWDYGPVVPEVYRQAKGFGSEPVRNVFHWVNPVSGISTEVSAINTAIELTKGMTPGQLVAATHSPSGAWAKTYRPNRQGLVIPNNLIAEEYEHRRRAA